MGNATLNEAVRKSEKEEKEEKEAEALTNVVKDLVEANKEAVHNVSEQEKKKAKENATKESASNVSNTTVAGVVSRSNISGSAVAQRRSHNATGNASLQNDSAQNVSDEV